MLLMIVVTAGRERGEEWDSADKSKNEDSYGAQCQAGSCKAATEETHDDFLHQMFS